MLDGLLRLVPHAYPCHLTRIQPGCVNEDGLKEILSVCAPSLVDRKLRGRVHAMFCQDV